MRTSWFNVTTTIVVGLALSLYAGTASAQSKIGVAATVKNQVSSSGRALSAGSEVRAQELVKTGDASSASLLFLDQTSLNVGPRSEVKLDRFVYDPSRGNGSVVINTGRGVFRFVSGSQNSKSYEIKTPVATIGVRGTVFYVMNAQKFSVVTQMNGFTDITPNNGQKFSLPPGWSAVIFADGSYQTFQSTDTTNFFRNAGLDQTLLEEYATFTGQGNIFGGLQPGQRGYSKGN
jgi:hypothetical protein